MSEGTLNSGGMYSILLPQPITEKTPRVSMDIGRFPVAAEVIRRLFSSITQIFRRQPGCKPIKCILSATPAVEVIFNTWERLPTNLLTTAEQLSLMTPCNSLV